MTKTPKHKWIFRARFRRHSFGWRSQPAVARVKEAVSEIKKVARKDPALAAEGAVLFLEKVSPALEQVDSSSGAIGSAVYNAIDILAPIISDAPADAVLRDQWLERLWQAIQEDDMPYIERLPDHWGALCITKERASIWADRFIDSTRMALSPDPEMRGYFSGSSACLSALLKAERYQELMALIDDEPHRFWHYRQYGVKALLALGHVKEALRYANESRGLNEQEMAISQVCEEILLAQGLSEEAYNHYAIEANWKTTNLATFRAIAKKYPEKDALDILNDLVESAPWEAGKWFASAKAVGLYKKASELAVASPVDPRTLTRAARDFAEKEPTFAVEAGLAALHWISEGYGYEITGLDVREAYNFTMEAARNAGCENEALARIQKLVAADTSVNRFVSSILGPNLGLSRGTA